MEKKEAVHSETESTNDEWTVLPKNEKEAAKQTTDHGESTHSKGNKTAACWSYGIGSAAVTIAGGALMVLGGPVGIIAGGIVMGAGLSGEVATIQQARSDNEEFSHKQVWIQTAVGAAGGVLTGGIGAGGGLIAAGVTNTAGRIGIQIGASAVGGAAGGGVSKLTSCALTGETISGKEIGKAMLLGSLSGAVGSGMGQLGGMAGKEIAMKFSQQASEQTQLLIKSALGITLGGATSALTAITIKVIDNVLKRKYIIRADISQVIGENPDQVECVWQWLIEHDYLAIIEEEETKVEPKANLTQKCRSLGEYFVEQEKPGNITSEEEKHLVDIFKAVGKIWDGVGEAAAYAAAIGAVAAGAQVAGQAKQEADVKKYNHEAEVKYNQKVHEQKINPLLAPPQDGQTYRKIEGGTVQHDYEVIQQNKMIKFSNGMTIERMGGIGVNDWVDKQTGDVYHPYGFVRNKGVWSWGFKQNDRYELIPPTKMEIQPAQVKIQDPGALLAAKVLELAEPTKESKSSQAKEEGKEDYLVQHSENQSMMDRFIEEFDRQILSDPLVQMFVQQEQIDPQILEKRKNYRKFIKNIDTEYFDLKYALFALNDFEDGVYHLQGEHHFLKGRLHHLIGIKILDKLHIFDYATDNKPLEFGPTVCHVNANKNFKYVLQFNATKVEDIDLKAIYLGKITSHKFEVKNVLAYLENFIYKESCYQHSSYNVFSHSCRTFAHTIACELGVEENYLKATKGFYFTQDPKMVGNIKTYNQQTDVKASYVAGCSKDTTVTVKPSIFKDHASIELSEKEQTFLMEKLPLEKYELAKWEYQLGGAVSFAGCMTNKKGVMIVIQSKKGIKFGGFFSANLDFTHGIVESHLDQHAVLFNITAEKTFPNQNKDIQSVHTYTKSMGIHPRIYFAQQVPNPYDYVLYDLTVNRRTVFEGPAITSCTNLPGFKIDAENGINSLTGEATETVDIQKIDIWSFH